MEKQRNRGQDGAGMANVKLDTPAGKRYISRKRSTTANPIQDLFAQINQRFINLEESDPSKLEDTNWLKHNMPFTGELFLGHLRYGTYGGVPVHAPWWLGLWEPALVIYGVLWRCSVTPMECLCPINLTLQSHRHIRTP